MSEYRQSILKGKTRKAHFTMLEILIKTVTTFQNQRVFWVTFSFVSTLSPLFWWKLHIWHHDPEQDFPGRQFQKIHLQGGDIFSITWMFHNNGGLFTIILWSFLKKYFAVQSLLCGSSLRLLEGARSPLWYLLCKHKAAREFQLQAIISKSSESDQLIQTEGGAQWNSWSTGYNLSLFWFILKPKRKFNGEYII